MPAKPIPPRKGPDRNDLRAVLAWHVRTLRVAKGWSQERLALACDLDRTCVAAVERSEWNVSLTNLGRLVVALDVETWTLLKAPN